MTFAVAVTCIEQVPFWGAMGIIFAKQPTLSGATFTTTLAITVIQPRFRPHILPVHMNHVRGRDRTPLLFPKIIQRQEVGFPIPETGYRTI